MGPRCSQEALILCSVKVRAPSNILPKVKTGHAASPYVCTFHSHTDFYTHRQIHMIIIVELVDT